MIKAVTDTVVITRRVRLLIDPDALGEYVISSPAGEVKVAVLQIEYSSRPVNANGRTHPWQFRSAALVGLIEHPAMTDLCTCGDHEGESLPASVRVQLGVAREELPGMPEWFRLAVLDNAPDALVEVEVPDTIAGLTE